MRYWDIIAKRYVDCEQNSLTICHFPNGEAFSVPDEDLIVAGEFVR